MQCKNPEITRHHIARLRITQAAIDGSHVLYTIRVKKANEESLKHKKDTRDTSPGDTLTMIPLPKRSPVSGSDTVPGQIIDLTR